MLPYIASLYLYQMEIKQEDNKELGRFYYEEDGKELAEMDYRWLDKNLMSIDHTEVDPQLEGKGVGKSLVEFAVQKARDEGYKIVAMCPFVKRVFEKSRDKYKDVQAVR